LLVIVGFTFQIRLHNGVRDIQDASQEIKQRGRPRNEEATAAILSAALDLMEEVGFPAVTMEGIAQRSGLSKTTIYRRWPGTWAVILDGFLAEMTPRMEYEEKATVRQTIRAYMTKFAEALQDRPGRILIPLLGVAQFNPELREALWDRYIGPRRVLAANILARGMSTGEIRSDVDAGAIIDTLYGSMVHRLLVTGFPLNSEYLDSLVKCVFSGIEPR
jgi:AcrR family transcriptional regulator